MSEEDTIQRQENTSEQHSTSNMDLAEAESSTSGPSSSLPSRLQLLDGSFFKYLPEESTATTVVGICIKCRPVIVKVKGYGTSTSNFISHLKRKHGHHTVDDFKLHLKRKRNEKMVSTRTPKREDRVITQEKFEDNLFKYFIHAMVPLRSVENSYFSKIFSDLDVSKRGLKLLSRRTLGRRIDDYYRDEIKRIRLDLQSVDYVCTTTDIWSGRRRSFIGVTAHWIAQDLRRKSAALSCKRFKGTYS